MNRVTADRLLRMMGVTPSTILINIVIAAYEQGFHEGLHTTEPVRPDSMADRDF